MRFYGLLAPASRFLFRSARFVPPKGDELTTEDLIYAGAPPMPAREELPICPHCESPNCDVGRFILIPRLLPGAKRPS